MADELEQIFSREVVVGVANVDVPTEEGTISARMVVQDVTGIDRETGRERRLLLIYEPDSVPAIADTLRQGVEKAKSDV
ncbi:hypothetical protein N5079_22685 [Planotetraspora sp. A-T 1434]|uniref:hypothetical protein n=1 Tax=Planotetraspora sp. A-T 1434 TaxID=2979219 RepID=UPI0021BFFCB7|nr:hypothetical protein [Planotetraspora sp. A-T 1434]MCT9933019.1 hypothetical protein [Planotetraspora sp. A-T 1434]